jgi:hypothetical protein
VIGELAIAKELSQHRKCVRRQRLIDKWLLAVECFDCGAAREWIFSGIGIRNLRIQLAHRAQTLSLAAVSAVQRLAKNILSTGSVISEIEPLSKRFSVYV